MFSPTEVDEYVNAVADVAIDATRDGVIHEPTLKALEMVAGFQLYSRLRRIQRWLTDHELQRPYFADSLRHTPTYLPRQCSNEVSLDHDIISSTLYGRAHELWPRGFSDWRIHDRMDLESEEWRENCNRYADRLNAVLEPHENRIDRAHQERRDAEAAESAGAIAARAELVRGRPASVPPASPYGVSARGAELLAADWMRHMGVLDAEVTPEKADGGIDVTSDAFVAQVKHYKGKVSVVEVRELFGVAAARGKSAVFFTSTGHTTEAITFATATEMALFVYSAERGTLAGVTEPAGRMA